MFLEADEWQELQARLGVTQAALGKMLGVSQPAVFWWRKRGGEVKSDRQPQLLKLLEKAGMGMAEPFRCRTILGHLSVLSLASGLDPQPVEKISSALRLVPTGAAPYVDELGFNRGNDTVVVLSSPYRHSQIKKIQKEVKKRCGNLFEFRKTRKREEFFYRTQQNHLCFKGKSMPSTKEEDGERTIYTDYGVLAVLSPQEGGFLNDRKSRLIWVAGAHRLGTTLMGHAVCSRALRRKHRIRVVRIRIGLYVFQAQAVSINGRVTAHQLKIIHRHTRQR